MRFKFFLAFLVIELIFATVRFGPYVKPVLRRKSIAITPVMDSLWKETEKCSGHRGNIHDVHFYVVRDTATMYFDIQHQAVLAFWFSVDNSITFHSEWMNAPGTIKHEMLHALRRNGDHDIHEFTDLCGLNVSV